jgi:integrase/recombinase XerC
VSALTEYAQTARLMRELERAALKDKGYRRFPIGQEVGRYLRYLRWSDAAVNTRDTYEIALSRLAVDFADFETLERFAAPDGTELVEEFLERHWGEAAPATRAGRLAAVRSFFQWAVEHDRLAFNPAAKIKAPRGRHRERQAYHRELIHRLVTAQPGLREQVALQLLGRLALRKNELRSLRIGDFDLARSEVRVQGKGGKSVVLPFGALRDLVRDLELHIAGETRQPDEYLLYPKQDRMRPLDPASVHRWFKRCLTVAGLPSSIEIHELRHSAADELWRITGDIVLAQKLLRHESVATTQAYLHPRREDLLEGLRRVDEAWQVVRSEDPDVA